MNATQQSDDVWRHDSLDVDDDGYVTGTAYTRSFCGGYDVHVGVTSYDYERNGETKTNHVPNVTVTNRDGAIVRNVHAHDSQHPQRAIENAKGAAELVVGNPGRFIE